MIDNHIFYQVGGCTIQLHADRPIMEGTFSKKLRLFQTNYALQDNVLLHHHFYIPDLNIYEPFIKIYHKLPWAVYRTKSNWIYTRIAPEGNEFSIHQVAVFNHNHTVGDIYSSFDPDVYFQSNQLETLTLFPTDQILLARVLADRQGCIFHSAGMEIEGQGFLFAGHSGAGKSTIVTQLMPYGNILCDDRMIIRRWPEGFCIHGTWSHGTVPIVSPGSAPLRAIFLLEQAEENRLVPVEDRKELARLFPFLIIKPLVTADWWEKTFDLMEQLIAEVPVYRLRFDLSGRIMDALRHLL